MSPPKRVIQMIEIPEKWVLKTLAIPSSFASLIGTFPGLIN